MIERKQAVTLAMRAVIAYRESIDPVFRPISRRLAGQRLAGMAQAADAIGLAFTPTHFEMCVIDAVRSAGDRPGYNAMNNDARKSFDAAVAADVVYRLSVGIS